MFDAVEEESSKADFVINEGKTKYLKMSAAEGRRV